MFHRKRASSNPPRVVKSTPSSAASLAATHAFLANRSSNANLSNAAAAAALRSHTTSPIPVGQLQTKRMQRKSSVSSTGSAGDRPGLQRRGSSGSLTERTFRDTVSPMPKRPASTQGTYTRYEEPPPVPELPLGYAAPSPMPTPQLAARRAASVQPPERVSSPPPRLPGGRGAGLDGGSGNLNSSQGGSKNISSGLNTVGEFERPGSRSSINFSRPMSPPSSSPASAIVGGTVSSPPPAQSTGVAGLPSGEVNRILDSIQETATAPVKKKKKVVAKGSAEGSHLATSIMSGAPQGPQVQTKPQLTNNLPTPPASDAGSQAGGVIDSPKPKEKRKKAATAIAPQIEESGEALGNGDPSDTDSVTSELSSTADRPRSYQTRAAGLLMKQPSIVREDREAEEQEDQRIPGKKSGGPTAQNGIVSGTTPANISKIVSRGTQHNRAASEINASSDAKRTSLDVHGSGRPQSLSPVRAAHFSSQPEYETLGGVKHQPPLRSVSPAKSALKHSPSRGGSPIARRPAARRQSFTRGDASDAASNVSDGSTSVPKKKSVRVSFDDDSIAVGRAASPPLTPTSPVVASPQNNPKGRSWFDLVREKSKEEAVVDPDQDTVIKPIPALPSFGSVRGRHDEPVFESTKDQKTSEDWAQDTLRTMDTSTDQVIGDILRQDAAGKAKKGDPQSVVESATREPVPPLVTSVEGSGYHSDDEAGPFDVDTGTTKSPSGGPDVSVPSIALQPATPALENTGEGEAGWLGMPGGFPGSSESSESLQTYPATAMGHHSPVVTPATYGLAEPELEAVTAQHDPGSPHVGEVAEGLRAQIEAQSDVDSEDTGNSIYSDAAEDPDDLEGDGFGSINAIIESPASPIIPLVAISPPASPSAMFAVAAPKPNATKAATAEAPTTKPPQLSPSAGIDSEQPEPASPGSDEGWDRAQAYWSGLSQTKKQQLEQAAVPGAIDEPTIPNKTMKGPDSVKKKRKKSPRKVSPPPLDASKAILPPREDQQYQNSIAKPGLPQPPATKSSERKSQTGPAQGPQMRSSMRGPPPAKPALKNSTQKTSTGLPPEPKGALQKKNRPVSAVAMVDYNKPQATHTRAASAGVPSTALTPVAPQSKKKVPAVKPNVFRNDSDSESSFKKNRPSTPSTGKYSMKRTMRPSSVDGRAQPFNAQTSSSPGSTARRHFSSVGPSGGGVTMRTSMRGSMDSGKPVARTTLRGSTDSSRPKSPSRFGFGKAKAKQVDSNPTPRFSSRFGDSSDEDDYRPTPSSRFADSSDEDEPVGLTPVRGIPRRIDEGDSTDLEDSDEDNGPATLKAKMNSIKPSKPTINTKAEGAALATGSLRVASGNGPTTAMGSDLQAKKAAKKENTKRSFFGVLGSRKKSDDPTRVRKPDIESAARRDTPLERSKAERMAGNGPLKHDERIVGSSSPKADLVPQSARPMLGSRTSTAQSSLKSPKLQRRNTPKSIKPVSDISWPLSQGPEGVQSALDSRPRTTDGPATSNGTRRPDVPRVQSEVSPALTAPLIVGKTEKKKRFGMLRRAFGMHD